MDLLPSHPQAPVPLLPSPFFFLSRLPAQLEPFYPYIAPGLAVHTAQNRGRTLALCRAFSAAALGSTEELISWNEISFQSIQLGATEAHCSLWGTVVSQFFTRFPNRCKNWREAWCKTCTLYWSTDMDVEWCEKPESWHYIWISCCSTSVCLLLPFKPRHVLNCVKILHLNTGSPWMFNMVIPY